MQQGRQGFALKGLAVGIIRRIRVWRDRRYDLIQLRHQVAKESEEFDAYVKKHDLKEHSDAFEKAFAGFRHDISFEEAEIDRIETKIAMERAWRWGAVIPPAPASGDDINDYWTRNAYSYRHVLTIAGHREIRHAVSAEMDMFFRPWLGWAAIGISVTSLIVSALKH